MALRYPDYARGVFTYLTTGGGTIGENLAKQYYLDYADLAEKEGRRPSRRRRFGRSAFNSTPATANA